MALKMMTSVWIIVTLNIYISVCVGTGRICATVHVWRPEDNLGVSSPLLPLWGSHDGAQVSRLGQQLSLPLDHLFGPRTNFAISQISMATLAVGSATRVCSSAVDCGTRKLFSTCFLPCHLRMPLCQLCGSLCGNLHFTSVTKGRAERVQCKYNKSSYLWE